MTARPCRGRRAPARAPAFLQFLVSPEQPVIPGEELDFRDEVMAQIHETPKLSLTFRIEASRYRHRPRPEFPPAPHHHRLAADRHGDLRRRRGLVQLRPRLPRQSSAMADRPERPGDGETQTGELNTEQG